MLGADLVRARRKGDTLQVTSLAGKTRRRAEELAALYISLLSAAEGDSYEELKAAWSGVEIGPREKKLADGLTKLLEDRCQFAAESPIEPRKLRQQVFLRAAQLRRRQGREFRRERILQEIGNEHELSVSGVEQALFADLKSQHRVLSVPTISAETLTELYQTAQYQAVLLRAVSVDVQVYCKQPAAYRELFRALKFRRLLYTITAQPEGYRIVIDGPFSLFESVTKYGLQLAMVFPKLLECDRIELKAQVRWGKSRTPLAFAYEHKRARSTLDEDECLSEETKTFEQQFIKLKTDWEIVSNATILDLPGVGCCVPDFAFERSGQRVYLELMGFWSRDAVWKRVELVQHGLTDKIIFAVSKRLRVSEAVLDDEQSAALYVFKGVMSAKAIAKKLEELV